MRKRKRYIKPNSKAKNPLKLKVLRKHLKEEDDCVGMCCPVHRIIYIDPRLHPKQYMDTLIHEALHLCFWNKSEKVILNSATTIANLLWRLGYRKK